ncbi:MAG: maleylpyruvate isomerase family mycothiol-dependent enzyme [Actinomycetota bacterium]|nr:maleylpyruvate isomerase family mycothiol-dependent enzyme [Actinomycetota bacterium]
MSSVGSQPQIFVSQLDGISHSEARVLAESQLGAMIELLRSLSDEDWEKPTECEGWRVRDIAAHVLGWAEALTSPSEMARLTVATRKYRKQFGDKVHAQNEAQVEMRRNLSTQELIDRLDRSAGRFVSTRAAVGLVSKYVPLYNSFFGLTTLRFLSDVIFTRDHFMHRIDISRAVDREVKCGNAERRIVQDVVRHWDRNAAPEARLNLGGPAGGEFVFGAAPRADIEGDALDFCRLLCGRADPSVMKLDGDTAAARNWLSVPVIF